MAIFFIAFWVLQLDTTWRVVPQKIPKHEMAEYGPTPTFDRSFYFLSNITEGAGSFPACHMLTKVEMIVAFPNQNRNDETDPFKDLNPHRVLTSPTLCSGLVDLVTYHKS